MVTALPPVQETYRKFVLYETKQTFYLVACTSDGTSYKVVEFDRHEPKELVWRDSGEVYDETHIKEFLAKLRAEHGVLKKTGLREVATAFGVVGLVRFMEGYYIVLVTKRKCVGQLGSHLIYRIESTQMIYLPHQTVRITHPDETKYVKIFQSVDLSSNFYFSYTYDLTNSLQCQMRNYPGKPPPVCSKFIWNFYLLRKVHHHSKDCPDWLLYIIHGYVGQFNISVFGRDIYLTLIARRSCRYAGTRFQKRGSNDEGHVANEVETEQIVHNAMTTAHDSGEFTSYLQHRGSVPTFWSQDNSGMPKPPISIDISDPFCEPAAKHYLGLLQRFGSPIIVLNLVKKREKRPREGLLTNELKYSVKYLNQFLPPEHNMKYIHIDMSRINKRKGGDLIGILEDAAQDVVKLTGFFHSGPELHCHRIRPHPKYDPKGGMGYQEGFIGRSQTGILRVNCVDCLDRTNTAQFIAGKIVLGHQLYALGVIGDPSVPFESDAMRMLEEAYETLGDILALQYGGSQLVHRIRSYRRVSAPVTTHAGDVYQAIQRYYVNFFADTDKQMAINLFLGMYSPQDSHHHHHLWELATDYYLHHRMCSSLVQDREFAVYAKWWSGKIFSALPLPYLEVAEEEEEEEEVPHFVDTLNSNQPDSFSQLYSVFELTEMDQLFSVRVERTDVSYRPADAENHSPFVQRVTLNRGESSRSAKTSKSQRVAPVGSPRSVEDLDSSSSTGTSSDEEALPASEETAGSPKHSRTVSSWQHIKLPSCEDAYGFSLTSPKRADAVLYNGHATVYRRSCQRRRVDLTGNRCHLEQSMWVLGQYFTADSCVRMTPPTVSERNMAVYEKAVNINYQQLIHPAAI